MFILLPHGPVVGGVTTWATGLVHTHTAAGAPAFILTPGDAAVLNQYGIPPGAARPLGALPKLSCEPAVFGQWSAACAAAVRTCLEDLPEPIERVLFLPQQLGEAVSLTPAIPQTLTNRQELRVAWVSHSPIAYNDRVASVLSPWLDAGVGVSHEITSRLSQAATDLPVHPLLNAVDVPATPPAPPCLGDRLRLLSVGRIEHEAKRVLALPRLSEALCRPPRCAPCSPNPTPLCRPRTTRD